MKCLPACLSCRSESLEKVYDEPEEWTRIKAFNAYIGQPELSEGRMRIRTWECRKCGSPLHEVIREYEGRQRTLFG